MKEVIVAKSAGFCFGVQRAVDTVYIQCGGKNVFTYGPIIHNEEVVKDLENKGVHVINSADEINDDSTVIIRSHGVSKDVYDSLHEKNVNIVDATCPFVLKIHKIVKEESANGSQIVIIGNIIIRNTICNATEERQTEAREIAKRVDAMIVIGGSSSSNTRKLYEICKKECYDTFYIQTINDLDLESLGRAECIGITAGASTPNNIIEEVCTNVRKFCRDVRGIN